MPGYCSGRDKEGPSFGQPTVGKRRVQRIRDTQD